MNGKKSANFQQFRKRLHQIAEYLFIDKEVSREYKLFRKKNPEIKPTKYPLTIASYILRLNWNQYRHLPLADIRQPDPTRKGVVDGKNASAQPSPLEENLPREVISTFSAHVRQTRLAPASDRTAVRFDHVRKTYKLYENDKGRFLNVFLGYWKNPYLSGERIAADDLSFEIQKGETVAFLGRNGMGKSTTLKMITGLSFPNSGTIQVNGRISALLELTAGFDGELTGRENIAIRGLIMGLKEGEIKAIEQKVVDFAELGLYIDQPLRTYSSGMKARLGFAFAVAIDPEILIVDETLSVGDKAFQQKCKARIREIMTKEDLTVLLVTHSAPVARELCSRGIVLDHGAKMFDGPIKEAVAYYEKHY